MVIHHMLALGAGFLLSSANLQTTTPPAMSQRVAALDVFP
jgi:hypothetical protein